VPQCWRASAPPPGRQTDDSYFPPASSPAFTVPLDKNGAASDSLGQESDRDGQNLR